MDFDEKKEEWSVSQKKYLPVNFTSKYIEAKKKAKELIEKKEFGLTEADFWILQNENREKTKINYTTLILTHNGCLKINDKSENKFNPDAVTIIENGYKGELVFKYQDKEQGIFEVGEVSEKNCKNDYPYAMALKRCFDRVVLKLSKLAFSGIMSDSEAEDTTKQDEEKDIANEKIDEIKKTALEKAIKKYKISDEIVGIILSNYNYSSLEDIEIKNYKAICDDLSLSK